MDEDNGLDFIFLLPFSFSFFKVSEFQGVTNVYLKPNLHNKAYKEKDFLLASKT